MASHFMDICILHRLKVLRFIFDILIAFLNAKVYLFLKKSYCLQPVSKQSSWTMFACLGFIRVKFRTIAIFINNLLFLSSLFSEQDIDLIYNNYTIDKSNLSVYPLGSKLTIPLGLPAYQVTSHAVCTTLSYAIFECSNLQ